MMTPEQLRAMRNGQTIPDSQQMLGDGTMSPQEQQQMMAMEAMYNPMLQMGGAPDIRRVEDRKSVV